MKTLIRKKVNFICNKNVIAKTFTLSVVIFFFIVVLSWADQDIKAKVTSQKNWNFDFRKKDTLPKKFLIGTLVDGRSAGKWQVIDMKKSLHLLGKLDRRDHLRVSKVLQSNAAPSIPYVFAQLKNRGYFTDFNVVLVGGTMTKDFDLKVLFLPIAGKADMGGGLIWRALDHENYYLARANPLEQNIRIYRVVDGVRHKLKNFNQIISVKTWSALKVVARGNRFQVFFNERLVLDIIDEKFQSDGKIGLWTKADAVTFFDNLQLSIVE